MVGRLLQHRAALCSALQDNRNCATLLTNHYPQAFENTSTSVAASQMRNALNNLVDTVKDPEQKKVGAGVRFPPSGSVVDVAV